MTSKFHFKILALGLLGASFALGGCGDDENGDDPSTDSGADVGTDTPMADTGTDTPMADMGNDTMAGPCDNAPAELTLDSDITEETWLCAATEITLSELVFVTGATLHIEAGTTIMGENGSALVIATDAMIDAQGTADAPIVMTSTFGDDAESGDWGGLVLLGEAPINVGTSTIEGMEASDASSYGGSDATHNCGTVRYVRIEYAGFVFGEDNELNGLTVGGCGSDTTLEFIQVHKGLDDGIEFFGGTASLRYAIVTQQGDDGLDTDEGWTGNAQFIVVQSPQGPDDDTRGFEWDNLGDDNEATPRTTGTVANVTLLAPGTDDDMIGMKIRRGAYANITNVIIAGFDDEPIDIDYGGAADAWGTGLQFSYIMNFANADWDDETTDPEDDDDGGLDEAAVFAAIDGYSTDDPMIDGWDDYASPNFVPAAASPAANGGPTPSGDWWTAADYYGAFEPGATDTWADGWTAFP